MSWLFSQALLEEYSADTSLAGKPSAQLNVMPTPHKFWRNDKTMESSDLSRFGLTLQLLTDDRGEELLTSFLAASHARTSASPAPAPGLMVREAGCGSTWQGSFARYDHDTSTWKTAQCSLLEGLDEFSETWPKWGSMRDGASYLLPTPALRICVSESGSWATPSASDARRGGTITPNMTGTSLAQQVNTPEYWPTPTASLGSKGGRVTPRKGREGGTLIEAVSARMWPTPCARDYRSPNSKPFSERGGGKKDEQLNNAVRFWPTPTAGSKNSAGSLQEWGGSKNWVRTENPELARGQLNPAWVEWLMGWPIGWTELKPLEMDKFHEWQQQHSIYFADSGSISKP